MATKQLERATRLITAATGEPYGDGMMVTDFFDGCAEPGYDDGPMIVGDWNDSSTYDRETGTRTVTDTTPSRLFDALETYCPDIFLDWCDEWSRCCECGKAIRSQGNSYHWTPSYAILGDDYVCHVCIADDPESYVETLVNNANTANTILDEVQLAELGFEPYNGTYTNGWFDGQTDDPRTILDGAHGFDDYVFSISENSQFYTKFVLFARNLA
tara:strand:+ start:615 stop:1256 length:642 start_codon:yes stop_codon:yes gene_type:complete